MIFQQRKDELIRKHYEKLNKWKDMLADAQVNPPGMPSLERDILHLSLHFAAPRPNPAVPGAAPGAPGVPMPGPGGQTPHGSFVPGEAHDSDDA